MEPTSTQPTTGYSGSTASPYIGSPANASTATDSHFSTTAAHATGEGKYPTDYAATGQPAASGVQGTINNALASGKKWLNDSGISDKAQQLPQAAKDLGNKAVSTVSGLSSTQKAVGVGLLAAAVAFIATRGKGKGKKKHKKHKHDEGTHEFKARRSPFDHQPHTKEGNAAYDRKGQRPWGASRYGAGPGPANRERINSGSGYSSAATHSPDFGSSRTSSDRSTSVGSSSFGGGVRRDQGPATGSHYDAGTSGSQNPNNLDDLNSAF